MLVLKMQFNDLFVKNKNLLKNKEMLWKIILY